MKKFFIALAAMVLLAAVAVFTLTGCERNIPATGSSGTINTQETTMATTLPGTGGTTPGTNGTTPGTGSTNPGIDNTNPGTGNNGTGTPGAGTSLDAQYTTLPLFSRLDFGTDSVAEKEGKTTHAYVVDALTYNTDALGVEFTEDTLRLTAKKNGTFASENDSAPTDPKTLYNRKTGDCYYTLSEFSLNFDNLTTYDFEDDLRSGYGTFAGFPFTFNQIGNPDAWRGYHQFMKIRLKNPTDNDKIAVQFNNSAAYASTQFMVMGIGKQKETFESYLYDLCYAATYASGKGVLLPGTAPGNNWTWKQNTAVSGLRFHLLGATCSYANAYLNNDFDEGESAADYDVYAEYFNRLDSRKLIQEGNTVEIDYIIFGSTPGQLQAYHSAMEDASLKAESSSGETTV